eukprot:NODE_2470_length_598_cov_305.965392_g2103_i0.p2 GENE.NODE_2470_length_598_cov_305.965392_g2103_i0~~NODE_2470_length_598_cov_305.965392_g2103_i0.p2  ORF type:complete len:103 (+),score=49.24 NODE_2470_length_598_cov_305.965392_g2103_i0:30-311(+)
MGVLHKLSGTTVLGGEYEMNLKSDADDRVVLGMAVEHVASPDLVVKGRMNTQGIVTTSFLQQLNPQLRATLTTEVNLRQKAPVKWGINFLYEQ